MKKRTLSILALLALTLTGCENVAVNAQPQQGVNRQPQKSVNRQPQNDPCMSRIYFDGHYYVKYETNSRLGIISITHDPDCPCREKGGENE